MAVGGEELPRASRETPARGDVPCRGHTSHWLLPPSTAGGSSRRRGLWREAAWQRAAMLWHVGKGAARRGLGEPESCTTATEQAGMIQMPISMPN